MLIRRRARLQTPLPPASLTLTPGSVDLAASGLQETTVTGRYEFLSADTSGETNLPVSIERVPSIDQSRYQ